MEINDNPKSTLKGLKFSPLRGCGQCGAYYPALRAELLMFSPFGTKVSNQKYFVKTLYF